MKYILSFLLLFPVLVAAQTYKYIGIEDGLSNRRIFNIQKDEQGYMWFLTNEGMDRYDGRHIKHYNLNINYNSVDSQTHLGWLYASPQTGLCVIGGNGEVVQYDAKHDAFKMNYKLPDTWGAMTYSYLDRNQNVWLCSDDSITLYSVKSGQCNRFPNVLRTGITAIEQMDDTRFFVATEWGVRCVELKEKTLSIVPHKTLDYFHAQVSVLYYHQPQQKLLIGSFERGIFVYDMRTQEITRPETDLSDVNITRIRPLNDAELLIATEGIGVYKINIHSHKIESYISANFQSYNEMKGNNVSDVFVDEQKRVWVANYPTGITMVDYRHENYHWMKHSIGNQQSIVNDQVHAVIEDSEGDLWFATSNGISLYQTKTKKWHSFLSSYDKEIKDKNHMFITLCEVAPGVIWAGGFTSGIYKINKKALAVEYFTPYLLSTTNIRPDKYIRDIIKDSKGGVWSGGYYNLKRFDLQTKEVHLYPGVNSITAIAERDDEQMWVGTISGLYSLNKKSGKYQYIALDKGTTYINSLYQSAAGKLYIGTGGLGLYVYDLKEETFDHYFIKNSALISNSILTILPEVKGRLMMSTENGVACFDTKTKQFHNLTRGNRLMPVYFNASSGALTANESFILGSTDGAIELPLHIKFPEYVYTKMIFSDLNISYMPVYPDDKDAPSSKNINDTEELELKYNQNTFSFQVSNINYDAPDNVLYTWKLEGFYDKWTEPSANNLILFTHIPAGKYTLKVRAVSREENTKIYEEREMEIVISQPFWLSWWALLAYTLLLLWGAIFVLRMLSLRKQKKASDEKTQFFINTAHDIRTPLTLIKAPLEELLDEEPLSEIGKARTNTALRNVGVLLRLTNNLINFERADVYSSELYVSEYELNTYMKEVYDTFASYAAIRHIQFTYKSTFSYMNVCFDKEKMDSILKNILSNSLKYTPENGVVSIEVSDSNESWKVVVKDTGIGIPASEQSKLFRLHFRASNAINSKVSGSGIGLMLAGKLVRLHGGKISVESVEQQGTTIQIVLPKYIKNAQSIKQPTLAVPKELHPELAVGELPSPSVNSDKKNHLKRVLIVEDNDELRDYLVHSLSEQYQVQACVNGKEAMMMVKVFWPELIISDIMMPEMRGDELCVAIKSDLETSHIPVLLLTALGDENNILDGLSMGADEYVVKPFNVRILRASIANLLANRDLLRNRYANLEVDTEPIVPLVNDSNSLDWIFISEVKKNIEENLGQPDFDVAKLCKLHGMSRTSFYTKLKAITGKTPTELIQTARLQRAGNLLREGSYTVGEVSDILGFSDSKYFREVFKKFYHVTPSQYAKGDKQVKI